MDLDAFAEHNEFGAISLADQRKCTQTNKTRQGFYLFNAMVGLARQSKVAVFILSPDYLPPSWGVNIVEGAVEAWLG
jgi:hypothetical protein